MAKAKLGILLQDLRGKAGNAVFRRTKHGTIVGPRVQGTNPNTVAQEKVRNAMKKASQLFEGFTAAQVLAWQKYADSLLRTQEATGKKYEPTAIDAYMQLAVKYLLVFPNGTPPSTPPTSEFVGDTITVSATAAAGKITYTASAANTAGIATELLLQPLKSANRKPQPGGYRTKIYFTFTSGVLSIDVFVPAGYYAAAYRFVKTATGQASPLVPIGVQAVTLSLEKGGKNAAPVKTKARKAA